MKKIGRERRHKRITKRIRGVSQKPRMVVFRSKKHIYVQIINDEENKVIAGFSTLSKDFKDKEADLTDNKDKAKITGRMFAQKVKSLGIDKISFDRAGYKFHGRIKALAEGAKEGGLIF